MYRGQTIAVVVPAYNVGHRIVDVVRGMPSFVDRVYVVDDGSIDGTAAVVLEARRPGVAVFRHRENRGVGAAIDTGYRAALCEGADVTAVMAGDGQMDPADLPALLDPIVEGRADYVKGNRFLHPELSRAMPRLRIVGNVVLSLLTKLSSGYWRLFDSQCGYTAASHRTLRWLDRGLFARYGYLNDLLARLRPFGARICEVAVRPIYEGEPSGIRLWTALHPIGSVLLIAAIRRLWAQRIRSGESRLRFSLKRAQKGLWVGLSEHHSGATLGVMGAAERSQNVVRDPSELFLSEG